MKLVRYGNNGQEKPGLIDEEGKLRDLSVAIETIDQATLSPQGLNSLRSIAPDSLPRVKGTPRLGVPFTGISKIVGVGLNYSDHAKEAGMPIPSEPILFMKATTCISGPSDPLLLPPGSVKTDWEVELAIVIGSVARHVPLEQALDHVAGYCVANDVSEREYQLERGTQWDKGKGYDTFGPLGPWLVTRDEVPDPQDLHLWLELNGQRVQDGNTSNMVFGCAELVSYISRFMTLLPGDVIVTGTPPGVGLGMKPPRFLQAGDSLRLGIDGLGVQEQVVTTAR
ncbi:MAG: fumarylacetoacetate hydrolase family protein [Rhodocyclaceae bacterium]|nr:fumarylacetoacetate hydrolase family protein [Rhodocyclaceae bacterium]MCB1891066.1 fumarylacetoacetate hydrolase family protein [Rhodocyclaceae bacterium]MCP5297074.1 fumarylacetoacetate hydrolase family protein [Zoogloeaceae bacterium]